MNLFFGYEKLDEMNNIKTLEFDFKSNVLQTCFFHGEEYENKLVENTKKCPSCSLMKNIKE